MGVQVPAPNVEEMPHFQIPIFESDKNGNYDVL